MGLGDFDLSSLFKWKLWYASEMSPLKLKFREFLSFAQKLLSAKRWSEQKRKRKTTKRKRERPQKTSKRGENFGLFRNVGPGWEVLWFRKGGKYLALGQWPDWSLSHPSMTAILIGLPSKGVDFLWAKIKGKAKAIVNPNHRPTHVSLTLQNIEDWGSPLQSITTTGVYSPHLRKAPGFTPAFIFCFNFRHNN